MPRTRRRVNDDDICFISEDEDFKPDVKTRPRHAYFKTPNKVGRPKSKELDKPKLKELDKPNKDSKMKMIESNIKAEKQLSIILDELFEIGPVIVEKRNLVEQHLIIEAAIDAKHRERCDDWDYEQILQAGNLVPKDVDGDKKSDIVEKSAVKQIFDELVTKAQQEESREFSGCEVADQETDIETARDGNEDGTEVESVSDVNSEATDIADQDEIPDVSDSEEKAEVDDEKSDSEVKSTGSLSSFIVSDEVEFDSNHSSDDEKQCSIINSIGSTCSSSESESDVSWSSSSFSSS